MRVSPLSVRHGKAPKSYIVYFGIVKAKLICSLLSGTGFKPIPLRNEPYEYKCIVILFSGEVPLVLSICCVVLRPNLSCYVLFKHPVGINRTQLTIQIILDCAT